jgi:hypothetical protein
MTQAFSLPANGSFSFEGRSALITGGARGVGAAIARELHAGGGKVAIGDVDLQTAQELARSLDPGGATAMALALDVRNKEDFLAARDRLRPPGAGSISSSTMPALPSGPPRRTSPPRNSTRSRASTCAASS